MMASMRGLLVLALLATGTATATIAPTQPAQAQEVKTIGQFRDWTAYTYQEGGSQVCYMASRPQKDEGNYTRRGEIFAIVSHRPAENARNIVSFVAGYPYKSGSEVSVTIDNSKQFTLFTHDETAIANKEFLLRDVVRASAAAPTFFEPEMIAVSDNVQGAFVDGGVSPYNNPSLQLLLLATLGGHGLNWPMGQDALLLVSLGTGTKLLSLPPEEVMKMPSAELGVRGLASLMDDSAALTELLMQWLSNSPTSKAIDSEIGALDGDILGAGPAMMSYLRYNVELDPAWLKSHLDLSYSQDQVDSIAQMDKPENMDDLTKIGKAAVGFIQDDHFPSVFDPK